MKVKRNRFKGVMLLATVFFLVACIPTRYFVKPEPVEGIITDYETGEPIPDAFVVARWTGTSGGLGHGGGAICFHVEVTRTDAEGHYFIPPPEIESDYPKYREPRILVLSYKPGYRRPYEFDHKLSPGDQLITDQELPQERIEYLTSVRRNTTCMQAGESERNLLELSKSLYKEVNELAVTKDEKIKALSFLQDVEIIKLGGDEANRHYYERREKLR